MHVRTVFEQLPTGARSLSEVLIAQRSQYQLEVDYVEALTNLWASALRIQGSLLAEGALDAPLMDFGDRE